MVPVLLMTGFLGSGKTTLLNRLLDNRPAGGPFSEAEGKLALIVNEFGDVGIDGDLLPDEMTKQIEIKGGCICCRLDDDLSKTLLGLLDNQPEIKTIVIETTGIAEPLPISWTLATDELVERVRLAAVITVVDPLLHHEHRKMSDSVDNQVEYSDILVASKLDLATGDQLAALESSIRERNDVAPFIAVAPEKTAAALWASIDDPDLEQVDRTAVPSSDHRHLFDSVVVEIDDLVDFERLAEELEELPPKYIRIKGIARAVDGSSGDTRPKDLAFHRVGARVSAEPVKAGLKACLVAIGRDLDVEALRGCIARSVIN